MTYGLPAQQTDVCPSKSLIATGMASHELHKQGASVGLLRVVRNQKQPLSQESRLQHISGMLWHKELRGGGTSADLLSSGEVKIQIGCLQ